jgi:tetratricopeptide (TPR) repeat protein
MVLRDRVAIYGSHHASVALVLNNLSHCYLKEGNIKVATDLLKESLVIDEQCFGSDHVNVAATLSTLGMIYGKFLEDLRTSLSYLVQAKKILIDNHGWIHESTLKTSYNLGRLYEQRNELDAAKNEYNEILRVMKDLSEMDDFKSMVQNRLELLEQIPPSIEL